MSEDKLKYDRVVVSLVCFLFLIEGEWTQNAECMTFFEFFYVW